MNKRVLSIIPARGGSKGIPRKNIVNLSGEPLIAWTINESLKSKYISKTIVSSDDNEILHISKKYGADTIKRPADLSNDFSTSESVATHVLKDLSSHNEEFDVLVLLQPTSPLRTFSDIDKALDILFNNDKATAVISGYNLDNKFLKAFSMNSSGMLSDDINKDYTFVRRQDLPKMFMPNGAIYIANIESFINEGGFYTNNTLPYEMSKENSLDIDTFTDLSLANMILNKKL